MAPRRVRAAPAAPAAPAVPGVAPGAVDDDDDDSVGWDAELVPDEVDPQEPVGAGEVGAAVGAGGGGGAVAPVAHAMGPIVSDADEAHLGSQRRLAIIAQCWSLHLQGLAQAV